MSAPDCPMCDGFGVPLGKLGSLLWFRCRQCGIQFQLKDEEIENGDEEPVRQEP